MGRLFRLFLILPVLTMLWGYSNSIGATDELSRLAGLPNLNTWTIPGVEKIVAASDLVEDQKQKAKEKARQAAVAALRAEVKRRYGPEAAALVPADLTVAEARKFDIKALGPVASLPDLAGLLPGGGKTPGKPSQPGKPGGNGTGAVPVAVNGDAKTFNKARALLADLPVKGRAPMTGYDRDAFGSAWSDAAGDFPYTRNGCDTRNDILRRDLVKVVYASGSDCKVARGVLRYDPYTGQKDRVFDSTDDDYATDLDAEHVVALGNAWVTGAQFWSADKRAAYANAPDVLMMVDPSANRQKGDADAATWLPANKPYRCAYVSRQVRIKAKWGLWVTAPEKAAIERVLSGCPR